MEDTVIQRIEPIIAKPPHIPRIGNFSFGVPVQPLFESEEAAHTELLMTFMPYLRRLDEFYECRTSDKRVVAEFQKLWQVWRQYVRKPS